MAADVLPARNLFKHQQADLVTPVQKVGGLRVVRGANQVALEHVFHDVGIFGLGALAHGVAHVGVALVAVEAADFERLAVKEETFGGEARSAKAEAGAVLVAAGAGVQRDAGHIEHRAVQLPQRQTGQ